jgi:eukaryotic-like serine/threonine-protein kinase
LKAAAKLIHPNVVTAFDAGQQGGVHYLVMDEE